MLFQPFYFVTTYFKINESDGRYVHTLVYNSKKNSNFNLLSNPPFLVSYPNNVLNF